MYKSWKGAAWVRISDPGSGGGNVVTTGDAAVRDIADSLRSFETPPGECNCDGLHRCFTVLGTPSSVNPYLGYEVGEKRALFAFVGTATDRVNTAVLVHTDDGDMYRALCGRAAWASAISPEGQSLLLFDLAPGESVEYGAWNGRVSIDVGVWSGVMLTDTRAKREGSLASLRKPESDNAPAVVHGDHLSGQARKINTSGGDYQESRVDVITDGSPSNVHASAITVRGNVGPGAVIGSGSVTARNISGKS